MSAVSTEQINRLNEADVTRHLVDAIESADLAGDPFDHIRMSVPFAASTFSAMRASIPADRYFIDLRHGDAMLPDGTSSRKKLILTPAIVNGLPADQRRVWLAIVRGINHRDVETAFKRKFDRALRQRFGTDPEGVDFYSTLVMFRDLAGYKIQPHPDSGSKAITIQFYLPADDRHPDIGTHFYSVGDQGQHVHAFTMPFVPNSGYAFAVTKTSFHGVDELPADKAPRVSMLLTFYVVKNRVSLAGERLKQVGQDIRGRVVPMVRQLAG